MATRVVEEFRSGPAEIRAAILEALEERAPDFVHLLQWDADGTTASGSRFGAKGSLTLEGSGPTTVTAVFSIGFPASLKISEAEAAAKLREALRLLKGRIP